MAHNNRHTRRQERRAARAANRAERRAGRDQRQQNRQEARAQRQQNRQGFLSGIVGDEGLGGLISDAGDAFGGGYDQPMTKENGDDQGAGGMSTTTLALIGLGAYMLMKKK